VAAMGAAYYGLTVLGVSYGLALGLLCAAALALAVVLFRRMLAKTAQTFILQELNI
jgi:hypothetical protein